MNKELLNRIKAKFEQRLQRKTGWGRNEVLEEYQAAVSEALLELLDEKGLL